METVFQYDIPVLHPFAVHFPTALFAAAALASLLWMARGATFWRRCVLYLLVLGTGGVVFAYLTGDAMKEQAEGVPLVDTLVGLHEEMAFLALVASGATLVGLAGISFWLERRTTLERDPPDPLPVRLIFGFLILFIALLVAWTARIGATMVWGVAA